MYKRSDGQNAEFIRKPPQKLGNEDLRKRAADGPDDRDATGHYENEFGSQHSQEYDDDGSK